MYAQKWSKKQEILAKIKGAELSFWAFYELKRHFAPRLHLAFLALLSYTKLFVGFCTLGLQQ